MTLNIIKSISLVITIVTFSNYGISQDKNLIDQVVGVVGKNIVLKSDIENQYYQIKAQGYASEGDLKCEVFEDMLFQKLLLNQSELDSIEVSEKEIDDNLSQRMRMLVSQAGSEEKLEEYLGKSILEFKIENKEIIKEQMLAEKMQQKITGDLKVSPAEIRSFFKKIPKNELPKVNTEYEFLEITKHPVVNESEIKRVKDKLNEFRDRVAKGDKFSTLALLYSEDPGTAKNGGEIGLFSRGMLVPEFDAVAFNMKVGELSRIVKTDYGYHIIQLTDKKGEQINARHILLKPKVDVSAKINAKNYLDSIKTQILSTVTLNFNDAATKFSDNKTTKNSGGVLINPQTGNSRFQEDQIDPSIQYNIRNLKEGEISKPFETVDDAGQVVYKIIKIKSKIAPHTANLKDDYQKIQDMALEKKKQDKLNDWVKKKQETTFISIDKSFENCEYKYKGWLK